ncbi:unnamed protein product [Lampetra planeri]
MLARMRPGRRGSPATLLPLLLVSTALAVTTMVARLGRASACPARCDCSPHNRSVVCHRRRLASIPEGIPTETRSLDLSKNRIRALAADDFAAFPLLEEVDVSENVLASVEDGAFNNLPNLRSLRLRSNRLKLIPLGAFAGLGNLTHLDISDNRVVVLLDLMFADLRSLRSLDVGDNELVYVSQRAFAGLHSLEHLALERCNLTSVPADALSHLHRLLSLRLRHLGIGAVPPYALRRLSRLKTLEVEHWPLLEALAPNSLYGLNLTRLAVTHCNLTAVPYAALRHLVYLRLLDLSFNPIAAVEGRLLVDLARLQELHLAGARLATVEARAFHGLGRLRLLNVSGNRLDTLEEAAFQSVANLAVLRLDGNPLACDCRLLWLLRRRRRLSFDGAQPACAAPDGVRGWEFRNFPDVLLPDYFTCRRPRILDEAGAAAAAPASSSASSAPPSPGSSPSRWRSAVVDEGHSAVFPCRAEGDPPPRVFWLSPQRAALTARGNGRMLVSPDGALEVRYAQPGDGGVYTCVAANAGGNDTLAVRLAVRGHAGADHFLHMARTTPLVDGAARPGHGDNGSWDDDGGGSGGGGSGDVALPHKRFLLNLQTVLVATAMGCCSFLGVVLLCLLLLFVWSRAKGRVKKTFDVGHVPRCSQEGGGGGGAAEPRTFSTRMM